jgi:signal transduction histidine kinase
LRSGSVPPQKAPDLLNIVEKAGHRAADLMRSAFSGLNLARSSGQRQTVQIEQLIDETMTLLRGVLGARITIQIRVADGLWPVDVESSQFSRLLMNLCFNARDAMPQGGELVVEAANEAVGPSTCTHPDARAGEFVRLRVKDSGHGIPDALLPRIFEPFVTTKPAGEGAGLGLAMVAGIVRKHQGWISCTSRIEDGTTFDVFLPRGGTARK